MLQMRNMTREKVAVMTQKVDQYEQNEMVASQHMEDQQLSLKANEVKIEVLKGGMADLQSKNNRLKSMLKRSIGMLKISAAKLESVKEKDQEKLVDHSLYVKLDARHEEITTLKSELKIANQNVRKIQAKIVGVQTTSNELALENE